MATDDGKALLCNACWTELVKTPACYRTSCDHMYCPPCANKYFSRKNQCPCCEKTLKGDDCVIEVPTEVNAQIAGAVIGYFMFHPSEALNLAALGFEIVRCQTALVGARNAWMKEEEGRATKGKLVSTENKLNVIMNDLTVKNQELERMAKALAAANSSRDDVLAKYNKLCQLHDQVTGRPGGSAMATAVVGSSKGGHGGSGSGLLMGAQGNHMPSTPMAGQNGAAMAMFGRHGPGPGVRPGSANGSSMPNGNGAYRQMNTATPGNIASNGQHFSGGIQYQQLTRASSPGGARMSNGNASYGVTPVRSSSPISHVSGHSVMTSSGHTHHVHGHGGHSNSVSTVTSVGGQKVNMMASVPPTPAGGLQAFPGQNGIYGQR